MKQYIKYILIALVTFVLIFSVKSCCDYKNRYDVAMTNIGVMTDTLHLLHINNDEVVYSASVLQSELKLLDALNKELYEEIKNLKKDLKVKSDIVSGIRLETKNEVIYKRDTIIEIGQQDSVTSVFSFNSESRILEGTVRYYPKLLNKSDLIVTIDKDIVYTNYTIMTDDNRQIYIKCDNPNVNITRLNSFQLPKETKKHWGVGLLLGVGYNFVNEKPLPYIGIGILYNLFQF